MAQRKEIFARIAQGKLEWGSRISDKMLSMNWTRSAGWTAPRIVPSDKLTLSPAAMVFHYGMAVFEGLKAYPSHSGPPRLFRPDLNIARLNASAKRMALPTVDPTTFMSALRGFVHAQAEWVPQSPGSSLYIRPTLIGTDPKIGVRHSDSALLYVLAAPGGSFFSSGYDGVRLVADPTFVRSWPGGVGHYKTGGNYALTIAPAKQAQDRGFDQILWLSDKKERKVGEVGMMNAMFVFDGPSPHIVTPRLDGTILPGITRQSIIDLAPGLGIEIEERDIWLDEVLQGLRDGTITEAFGTGTAAVITPIRSITYDGVETFVKGNGEIGKLLRKTLNDIFYSKQPHPWMIPAAPFDTKTSFSERKVSVSYA